MGTLAIAGWPTYMSVIWVCKQSPKAPKTVTRQDFHPLGNWKEQNCFVFISWLTLLWPRSPVFVYQRNQHIPPGELYSWFVYMESKYFQVTESKYFQVRESKYLLTHLNSGFSFALPRKPIFHVTTHHPILLPEWMNHWQNLNFEMNKSLAKP